MKYLTFLLIVFLSFIAQGAPISISSINAVRLSAGLNALAPSLVLTDAADAHAYYLSRYMSLGQASFASAHEENPNVPEFTGKHGPERALTFGYPHSQVSENISIGNSSVEESVADLMSAIYHRFAFLDFEVDEIGAASVDRRYVYEMGQQNLANVCVNQPELAKVTPPYNCLGSFIPQSTVDQLCANIPEEAKFTHPYPKSCPNGKLLRTDYMNGVCESPPKDALFNGVGGFYSICGNTVKINAAWLNQLCSTDNEKIIYTNSANAYQICESRVEVHANWYENFCTNTASKDTKIDSGRYYDVCRNGFKIKSETYLELEKDRFDRQPAALIWPANGLENIKPVFYDEAPHPTPDLPMTGYPISIQFNPKKVKQVSISYFVLEAFTQGETPSWTVVPNVRQVDYLNDINQLFDPYQFAWFPLRRLKWGTQYRYTIHALVDGVPKQYHAQFKTLEPALPLYFVDGADTEITILENNFILYREPDGYDSFPYRNVNVETKSRANILVNVIDSNTVELNINNARCKPVFLHARLGEGLRINTCMRKSKASFL